MGTPKKPKPAGVQKGKTKAAKSSTAVESKASAAALESPVETESSAANGDGAPTEETIRLRAYEIFMSRDGRSGDELSDWLAAEREIMDMRWPHSLNRGR